MNIFRSLIGKVWQDPDAAEVVKIPTGQLFLVRPGNIRSSSECIYQDAIASIRRFPNAENTFQLVITRVYEEGDQELLEDEDETDDERVFLATEELEFRVGETDGDLTFIWRDLQGDVDELYQYVAPETNEPTGAFFVTCMYRAMYERKYRHEAPDSADFSEFIWEPKSNKKKKSESESTTTTTPSTPAAKESGDAQASSAPAVSLPSGLETVVSHEAELYLWNQELGEFYNQGIFTAQIARRGTSFDYYMIATLDGRAALCHQINSEMNPNLSQRMCSITWNHFPETGDAKSWLFRFETTEVYDEFLKIFTTASWETLHRIPWSKAKADEQSYVLSSYNEDVEMQAPDDEEDDEDAVADELEADDSSEDEEDEGEDDPDDLPPPLPAGERNSQLTIGYKGDRSYVVRGNNIGVFSNNSSNEVKYVASISKIATPKGKEFKPKEIMLHDQDSKMVMMNAAEPNSLYHMDIEAGKIVEEWKVHDDVPVNHIAPESKFAQTTREQTLVGASGNAIYRIDPRVAGKKLVDSQYKQYASKNKFSGLATTAGGKLAVASEKGDIRLFDSIGKIAKTALPPLGDPIVGIDVTANGRWIVATTKTYLLLIDTLIGEGKWAGSYGFDKSFPANAKPIPKRLQLRSEHVAYMNHDISFSPARFNQGQDSEENAIVTSTGEFVVAWDFGKVKKGQVDRYEIKKYEDQVVQDNFKFGDDKEIIVALQNNVLAVNKKALKKPTRHSLVSRPYGSRSDIVNAPY